MLNLWSELSRTRKVIALIFTAILILSMVIIVLGATILTTHENSVTPNNNSNDNNNISAGGYIQSSPVMISSSRPPTASPILEEITLQPTTILESLDDTTTVVPTAEPTIAQQPSNSPTSPAPSIIMPIEEEYAPAYVLLFPTVSPSERPSVSSSLNDVSTTSISRTTTGHKNLRRAVR